MKKIVKLFFVFAATFALFSCNDGMISAPTEVNSSISKSIKAPSELTASQGGFRNVVLNWTGVSGAYQYFIYSSISPYLDFERTGETSSDVCSYTIAEEAGTVKYYKVSAVKYDGTESDVSYWAKGSVLAVPKITSIIVDSDTATVSWWMNNCDSSSYLDKVSFHISCWAEKDSSNKKEIVVKKEANEDFYTDAVTFTNLEPNNSYCFSITAYAVDVKGEVSKTESSKTAHILIPSAPVDFAVSKGDFSDKINISWTLPGYTDVQNSDGSYSQNPVRFKLLRKLKGAEHYNESPVASFSSLADTNHQGYLTFDCNAGTTGDANLTINTENKTSEISAQYETYIPGCTLTYSDTTAESGKQYEYKLQSYVDDVTDKSGALKDVTSNTLSAAAGVGNVVSVPGVKVTSEYKKSEDNSKFVGIKLKFNSTFNSFDLDSKYKFVMVQTFEHLVPADSNNEKKLNGTENSKLFNSIAELNAFVINFNSTEVAANKGYYKYQLNVVSSDDATQIYVSSSITNNVTITDDPDAVPVIENFVIDEGYADKFILKWKYYSDCTYILEWTDNNSTEKERYTIEPDAAWTNETEVSYEHSAPSGVSRAYTLIADKGLTNSENKDAVKTLGTPKPVSESPYYDKIVLKWLPVQMAKNDIASAYSVTAKFEDETQAIDINSTATVEAVTENQIDYIKYTLSKPVGYNDASKSGKSILFTVKANSEKASTEKTVASKTLGPALLNVLPLGEQSGNLIDICWNKVEGAAGYLIFRTKYFYNNSLNWTSIASTCDKYFVSGNDVTVNGESVNSAKVFYRDNKVYFEDIYKKRTDENSSYQLNQAGIIWGLPFGYVVIPVLDKDDFTRTDEPGLISNKVKLSLAGEEVYSITPVVHSAAYGYGLNVKAAKADDGEKISIEWNKPYLAKGSPVIYRKKISDNNAVWKKVSDINVNANDTNTADRLSGQDKYSAYKYAVYYTANSSSNENPFDEDFEKAEIQGGLLQKENRNRYKYDGEDSELLNKGYLLSLPVSAAPGITENGTDRYSEVFKWNNWNADERKIQPDSYELYIFNANKACGWTKVATIGKDCQTVTASGLSDITVTASSNVIKLEPTGIAAGTSYETDGMLKVLRDYKHYYKLKLIRNATEEETSSYDQNKDENDTELVAYRDITDTELAKAALLSVSYAFFINDGGMPSLENVGKQFKYGDGKTLNGYSGTATFTKGGYQWLNGKYNASYSLNNYVPEMLTPSGKNEKFLVLSSNADTGGVKIKGSADYYLYQFDSTNILDVMLFDKNLKFDYSAIVKFDATSNNNLKVTITRNGTTKELVNTSDNGTRKQWFPMQIHSDKSYEIKSEYYGWWESASNE